MSKDMPAKLSMRALSSDQQIQRQYWTTVKGFDDDTVGEVSPGPYLESSALRSQAFHRPSGSHQLAPLFSAVLPQSPHFHSQVCRMALRLFVKFNQRLDQHHT